MKILTEPQVHQFVENLTNEWIFENNILTGTFEFESFLEALGFVNDLAEIVENMGHHPDIMIQYNKVILMTTTHEAEDQITDLDTALIKEIEQLID